MTPEAIINDVLEKWAAEFLQARESSVRKESLISSQELLQSFRAQLQYASSGQNARAEIGFSDHGRILDMKKVQFSGMPNPVALEDYVRKKGVESFRKRHREVRNYIPKDQDKLISDIAFGIGIGIMQKNKFRRRKWYNQPTYKGINILYRRLLDGLSGFTSEQIREALK